jgi:hypothetical protein
MELTFDRIGVIKTRVSEITEKVLLGYENEKNRLYFDLAPLVSFIFRSGTNRGSEGS